jgi:hypothetical protein
MSVSRRHPSLSRIRPAAVAAALLALTVAGLAAPPADAVSSSSITISGDGYTVAVANPVQIMTNSGEQAMTGPFGTGTLTQLMGSQGGDFVGFVARGGLVKKTGGSCAVGGTYYRMLQVTLGALGSSPKDVWAFWDASLSSSSTPHFNADNARITATVSLEKLCDGTAYLAGTQATLDLDAAGLDAATAGVLVANTSATSVSFDIYVPTASNGNSIALGFVVDGGTIGTLDDGTDAAILTSGSSPVFNPGSGVSDLALETCASASPAAGDAPCVEFGSFPGLFASNGSTSLGSVSVEARFMSGGGQTSMQSTMGLTQAGTSGFAAPSGSIAKFQLSLPTSGTHGGVDFAIVDFTRAGGNTALKVDPNDAIAPLDQWSLETASGRRLITVVGEARATSSAINRLTWQDSCRVSISGSTVTPTGCGEDLTDYLVADSVPLTFGLGYSTDPVMQTIAGGFVSTNAQGMSFGAETMAGTSFQFGVAGPSVTSTGASRATAGFYYVCVPAAFLSGSFGTTPADASSLWIGTRDGVTTGGTTFAVGTCGIGAGLVATLDPFGYSSPLFRVKPPAAVASSPASSGSTEPATIPTVSTPVVDVAPTVTVPTVAPVILPTLSGTHPVAQGYLLSLADWTPGPGAKVSISIPRMFQKACRVVDGRVAAIAAGTCGVRITVVSPTGRRYVRRVHLTARV